MSKLGQVVHTTASPGVKFDISGHERGREGGGERNTQRERAVLLLLPLPLLLQTHTAFCRKTLTLALHGTKTT